MEGQVDFRGAGYPKVPALWGTFLSRRLWSPWGPGKGAQSNSCFSVHGIQFPSKPREASLLRWRLIFSVLSTILWAHAFSYSRAKMLKEPCAGHGNAGARECQSPDSAPLCPVPLQLAFLCHPGNFSSFS